MTHTSGKMLLGQKKIKIEGIMIIFEACLRIEPKIRRYDAADVAGFSYPCVDYALQWLIENRWLDHPRQGTYIITESGRIAWALWTAKNRIWQTADRSKRQLALIKRARKEQANVDA